MPKDVSIPHATQATVDMTEHSEVRRGKERLLGGFASQQPFFPILLTYDTSCRPSKRGTSLRAETSLGIKTDIH